MDYFEVRGVPSAMRQDGWWLSGSEVSRRKTARVDDGRQMRAGMLIALVALADVLMWQVAVGVSLAVFAVALVFVAIMIADPIMDRRRLLICVLTTLLSVLPVVELVQPLSVFILCLGISTVLSLIAGLRVHQLMRGCVRMFWVGPMQAFSDGWQCAVNGGPVQKRERQVKGALTGWGLPLVLSVVFVVLFAQANPVLDDWIAGLVPTTLTVPNPLRGMFWVFIALISWPCLILWRLQERLRVTRHTVHAPRTYAAINQQSVLRSLVIFNLMFAVQTGMDVFFLYGGGTLPDGMTYAQYAHRGAYPLVVTALLAGVFSLMSRPFAKQSPVLRYLLLLWVVQTLALVCASLVRLELYIDTYGLTHWRLAALIWMGLVAAGLCVIWLQISKDRENGWMVLRVGVLAALVLYACSFVSFDRTIARYNLTHNVKLDSWYLCNLGEAALPEIQKQTGLPARHYCSNYYHPDLVTVFTPDGWREWGFRNWRVRRSLTTMTEAAIFP